MDVVQWCCKRRVRSKTPVREKVRDGGTPPHHGKRPAKKLTEKITEKGGTEGGHKRWSVSMHYAMGQAVEIDISEAHKNNKKLLHAHLLYRERLILA